MSPMEEILQAITVVCELTATEMSGVAKAAMAEELLPYPLADVLAALRRCRRELTGRLTLAAVLSRMDTGLISADEAFGLLVDSWKNESLTLVIPEIAMQAMGMGAQGLLNAGDKVGARMAFKEAYNRLAGSLKTGEKPQWFVSAGTDKQQMTQAIMQAVEQGRLTKSHANALLPGEADEARHLLETGKPLSLEDKTKQAKRIAALLEPLKAKIGQPHWLEAEAERERQAERERFEQARQKALARGGGICSLKTSASTANTPTFARRRITGAGNRHQWCANRASRGGLSLVGLNAAMGGFRLPLMMW